MGQISCELLCFYKGIACSGEKPNSRQSRNAKFFGRARGGVRNLEKTLEKSVSVAKWSFPKEESVVPPIS
jgi:hypothetical protein